ncbi:30S ribosomal protein S3 [bacterium]|nr:30S ribosomal protein S3 [bacterium]MCB2202176.1 30S ribosomal protein S3 [bacterium]
MGQKTHPIGFRLGVIRHWNNRWFAPDRNFADLVHEDMMVKRYINRRLDNAGIANVVISRQPKKVTVDIMTSRPGIVIGRRGAEVDKLREELQLLTSKEIMLNIVEVRKPELDAKLVADSIARQIEGRVSFRRALKKSVAATMKMGAEGIKVQCAGRLGGAEIARTEKYKDGRTPLHTLRADIDYATSTANTTYGTIGIKVWICRGEVLDPSRIFREDDAEQPQLREPTPQQRPRRDRRGGPDQRKRPRGRVRRQAGGDTPPPRGRRPEGGQRGRGDHRPAPRPEQQQGENKGGGEDKH